MGYCFGCLPIPIFNQKKRNRQPLTSFPQKNELCSSGNSLVPESSDFCAISTDLIWESRFPQPNNPGKRTDNRSTGKKHQVWPEEDNIPQNSSTCFISDINGHYGQKQTLGSLKEQRVQKNFHFQVQSQTKLSNQISTSTYKKPLHFCDTSFGPKDHKTSYTFKNNTKLSKYNAFAEMPEEEMIRTVPLYHITFKQRSNSLRIISASIESMKHWSQFTDRTCLLFEVLATLDSAVTSGDHGSKTFLLRDGKNSIHCVFYEIDRELPRLIRGRVHRSMGNYDKNRNLFRCVSVRSASLAEQQTFHKFIIGANNEMEQYVKTINEI
ncbi:spermatogenesis-associated protein 22 [Rhinophrynus dorsalis]